MALVQKEHFLSSKSYVLRKSRITKAQRKALTALRKDYILEVGKNPFDFSKAFKKQGDFLIADIGFGSGESLLSLAENNQNSNIIGIEVYPSGIGKVLNQIKQRNLTNLKIVEPGYLL